MAGGAPGGDNIQSTISVLQSEINELKKESKDNAVKVASVQGQLTASGWILGVGALLFATINIYGGIDYLKNRSALLETTAAASSALHTYGIYGQRYIVDSIDAEFDKQVSLDSLRDPEHKDIVHKLQSLSDDLERLGPTVPEDQRSTYQFVVEALTAYLDKNYVGALESLQRVTKADRQHFIYYYMRGACSMRLDKLDDAKTDFQHANSLIEGRTQLVSMDALGYVYLDEAAGDQKRLKDAATVFYRCIKKDPDYAPAYFNLAATMAAAGPAYYDATTCFLELPTQRDVRPIGITVRRIQDDLAEHTEHHLDLYVKNYLGVTTLPDDPDWERQVLERLNARWESLGAHGKKCPDDFDLVRNLHFSTVTDAEESVIFGNGAHH